MRLLAICLMLMPTGCLACAVMPVLACTHGCRRVAIMLASRMPCAGVAARWREHLALTLRPHYRESNRLRYKMMEGLRPDQMFFPVGARFLLWNSWKSSRDCRMHPIRFLVIVPKAVHQRSARKQCAGAESGSFDL